MNFALTPNGKEATMAASEMICREFARQFDTPNVRQAISLCEAGTLTWEQVEEIFRSSLAQGLREVA
jgi:hypothetical protein